MVLPQTRRARALLVAFIVAIAAAFMAPTANAWSGSSMRSPFVGGSETDHWPFKDT
jgi:hypothetical protein